ncbi:MAG TPA: hypothetical protein VHB99_04410, partial [Pirellulales bacterium]|nr:hypothetical protein [Pirellulales bacterium]
MQKGTAHRGQPPAGRAQSGQHQPGITHARADSRERPDDRHEKAFGQQRGLHPANLEADGSQNANLSRALLGAEAKQQQDQHQSRCNDKEAEAEEQLVE